MTVTLTITHREAADGSVTTLECEAKNEFGEPLDVSYALLVGIIELAKDQVLRRRWEEDDLPDLA